MAPAAGLSVYLIVLHGHLSEPPLPPWNELLEGWAGCVLLPLSLGAGRCAPALEKQIWVPSVQSESSPLFRYPIDIRNRMREVR